MAKSVCFTVLYFCFGGRFGSWSPAGANRFHNPIETLQFHLIIATATATTSQTSKRSLSVVDVWKQGAKRVGSWNWDDLYFYMFLPTKDCDWVGDFYNHPLKWHWFHIRNRFSTLGGGRLGNYWLRLTPLADESFQSAGLPASEKCRSGNFKLQQTKFKALGAKTEPSWPLIQQKKCQGRLI